MRVLKSVTLDPAATTAKEQGGKHAAELMEQRRLQRTMSVQSRNSNHSDNKSDISRVTSGNISLHPTVLDEMNHVRAKLDDVASMISVCMQDTHFIRSAMGIARSGSALVSPAEPTTPPQPDQHTLGPLGSATAVMNAREPSGEPDPMAPIAAVMPPPLTKRVMQPKPEMEPVMPAAASMVQQDRRKPARGLLARHDDGSGWRSSGETSDSDPKEAGASGGSSRFKSRSCSFNSKDSKGQSNPSGDELNTSNATSNGSILKKAGSMSWDGFHNDITTALYRVRKRDARVKMIWTFLENPGTLRGSLIFARFVSLLIFVSSFLTFAQTGDEPPINEVTWFIFEMLFDVIFTLEVVIRFLVCPDRVRFVSNPYNLIDIIACVAVTVRSISADSVSQAERSGNLVLLTLSFAVPILRLLKLLRRFETFHLITKAFRLASEALPVLLFILSILVLTFASAIYICEPRSNIESLPRALWFTIVTVGTVGYGDIVPVSVAGSITVSLLIVVSALYMAIPIGIVGKAFSAVWEERDVLLLMHRTRARFEEHGYKAADVPAMFFSFDHNSDGELDFQEFVEMMEYLQIDLGGDRLLDLFSSFDYDSSGAIDDKEFVRTLFPSAYAQLYGKPKKANGDSDESTERTVQGEPSQSQEGPPGPTTAALLAAAAAISPTADAQPTQHVQPTQSQPQEPGSPLGAESQGPGLQRSSTYGAYGGSTSPGKASRREETPSPKRASAGPRW